MGHFRLVLGVVTAWTRWLIIQKRKNESKINKYTDKRLEGLRVFIVNSSAISSYFRFFKRKDNFQLLTSQKLHLVLHSGYSIIWDSWNFRPQHISKSYCFSYLVFKIWEIPTVKIWVNNISYKSFVKVRAFNPKSIGNGWKGQEHYIVKQGLTIPLWDILWEHSLTCGMT